MSSLLLGSDEEQSAAMMVNLGVDNIFCNTACSLHSLHIIIQDNEEIFIPGEFKLGNRGH